MRDPVKAERLRADVEKAEAALDQAREKFKMLKFGCGRSTLSDGTMALSEARLLREQARKRLRTALARFSSFVF